MWDLAHFIGELPASATLLSNDRFGFYAYEKPGDVGRSGCRLITEASHL